MKFLTFLLVSSTLAACAHAHGYLINPPNRGSAWREDPIKFPAYYQDNGLYCGDSSIMMNSVNRKRAFENKGGGECFWKNNLYFNSFSHIHAQRVVVGNSLLYFVLRSKVKFSNEKI